jgi:hypothetical protein
VADFCVVGGYAQYAIRPARLLVPVPAGVDAAEAVCIPLAYLTAFQMLTRYRGFCLARRSSSSARLARSARRCSILRVTLASRLSVLARQRTSSRTYDLGLNRHGVLYTHSASIWDSDLYAVEVS